MIDLMWGQHTHTGRRQRNEDAIISTPSIFAVADGMGGHAGGEVASFLAVEALRSLESVTNLTRTDVLEAIRRADREIARQASGGVDGMGTTISGLAVTSPSSATPRLVVFNVGDSRTYRFRDGELQQLTRDHSLVQELLEAGEINWDEVVSHPQRHVITRSLGAPEPLEIDWWTTEPIDGDRYLVASDGLSAELDEALITELLTVMQHPQEVADQLTKAALAAGGRDNISVIVVDVLSVTSEGGPGDLDSDTEPREHSAVTLLDAGEGQS